MAKMKNEDFIRDAKVLISKLDEIENLNVASKTLLNQAKVFVDDGDGRYAFHIARSAEVMHDYNLMARKWYV